MVRHSDRHKGFAVSGKLRNWVLAIVCLTITSANAQNATAPTESRTFRRLCGRLESMWGVPEGHCHKIWVEHRKPLPKTLLELFQWREGIRCCSDLTLVERVTTKRDGAFDFTNSAPGKYLVVAHSKGTHSLEIEIIPDDGQHDNCALQGLDIDESGKLDQFLTVKLD